MSEPASDRIACEVIYNHGRTDMLNTKPILNTNLPPFDDIRVRQAFADAIDRLALIDTAYDGVGFPVDTIFTESSALYEPDLTLDLSLAYEMMALDRPSSGEGPRGVTEF